jgi:hypothetical protein
MTDDEWIAYGRAAALMGDEGAVLRALRLGRVRSRGVPALEATEPVDIGPDHWATMVFNRERQSLDPPSNRRIPTGFTQIKVSRSDVEQLASPMEAMTPREGAGLPAKENIPEAAAAILRGKVPRRPPHKRETLRGIVSEALGREIARNSQARDGYCVASGSKRLKIDQSRSVNFGPRQRWKSAFYGEPPTTSVATSS